MKRLIYRLARAVRHAPIVNRLDVLWEVVRKPYHTLLNTGGGGVRVRMGELIAVTIPAEALGWQNWEALDYEREPMSHLVMWLRDHPNSQVLDVGCANGLFTLVALAASDQSEVVAIDSDLPSLALTRRLISHTPNQSVRFIQCLVGKASSVPEALVVASHRTTNELATVPDDAPTTYRCLPTDGRSEIPILSLDDLLAQESTDRPLLIKCDVEGAEMLVLEGAQRVLHERRPALLLSVHPRALPQYDATTEDLFRLLSDAGYHHQLISEDHEEHWWCVPNELA